MNIPKYDKWFKLVDKALCELAGIESIDLPPYPYLEAFEGGGEPLEVAKDVLSSLGIQY